MKINKINPIRAVMTLALAMVMTAVLFAGNAVPVHAATGDVTVTGNVTKATDAEVTAGDKIISITSPSGITDDDTVTYTIYKIFNATTSSGGTAYTTIPDGLELPIFDDGSEPLSLSKFDIDSGGNVKYYTRQQTYQSWQEDTESTQLTDDMVSKLSEQENVAKYTQIGTVSITGATQTAHVKVSDYGYYYISTYVGSAAGIDTTHPSITITDKTPFPSLDKKQSLTDGSPSSDNNYSYNDSVYTKDALSASVGDSIYYNVPIEIPKKANKDIVITDLVSEGLTLDTSSLSGRMPDNFDERADAFDNYSPSPWSITGSARIVGSHWTLEEGEFDADGNTWIEGTSTGLKYHKYAVTIPSGLLRFLTNVAGAWDQTDPYTFTLYYKATLNANAQNERAEKNRVNLTYEQYTSPFHEVQVTPYGFDLVKTDKDKNIFGYNTTNGGAGADGSYATFKLYKANAAGDGLSDSAINFVESTTTVAEADSDTNKGLIYNYRVAMSGETSTDTIKAGDTRISGLAAGTYYLVEEKAPDGYNKIASNVKVVVGAVGITVGNGTANSARYATTTVGAENRTSIGPKNGIYTSGGVQVENQAGTVLPSTGGNGTTIFYIVGGVIIVGAIILLITRRKKGE